VTLYSVAGSFIRDIGAGVLYMPVGVACSAFDELVVADGGKKSIFMFSATGALLRTFGDASFSGVVLHRGTVFAVQGARDAETCILFN
jgi:hypothetical protein